MSAVIIAKAERSGSAAHSAFVRFDSYSGRIAVSILRVACVFDFDISTAARTGEYHFVLCILQFDTGVTGLSVGFRP